MKNDEFLKTVAMVAKMGVAFAETIEERNAWKKRMLLAGLDGDGLSFPDDWDALTEEEKEIRLDKVIAIAGGDIR